MTTSFSTLTRKDGSRVYLYGLQIKLRDFLYRKIGHWQYGKNQFKHDFAFSYFTGSYIFPVVPFMKAVLSFVIRSI